MQNMMQTRNNSMVLSLTVILPIKILTSDDLDKINGSTICKATNSGILYIGTTAPAVAGSI